MITFRQTVAAIAVAACVYIGSSAVPVADARPFPAAAFRQTAQIESVTGRITEVTGNTFTIEPSPPEKDRKFVLITVDQDTVVHGKITVGLKADVSFRRQDHNNIAVTVRTSPAESQL